MVVTLDGNLKLSAIVKSTYATVFRGFYNVSSGKFLLKAAKKFCILTTARSGSTWLVSMLDSHPHITSLEEPFLWRDNRLHWNEEVPTYYDYCNQNGITSSLAVFGYLNLIERKYADAGTATVGFKLMYSQLKRFPLICVKLIVSRYSLIHLVRTNYLDILISRTAAKQHAVLHSIHAPGSKRKSIADGVILDEENLLSNLKRLKRNSLIVRIFMKCLPLKTLEVVYEDMLSNKESVLREISNHLSIDYELVAFHSELERLQVGAYQKKIVNYEEISKRLAGSDFEYLIHI